MVIWLYLWDWHPILSDILILCERTANWFILIQNIIIKYSSEKLFVHQCILPFCSLFQLTFLACHSSWQEGSIYNPSAQGSQGPGMGGDMKKENKKEDNIQFWTAWVTENKTCSGLPETTVKGSGSCPGCFLPYDHGMYAAAAAVAMLLLLSLLKVPL